LAKEGGTAMQQSTKQRSRQKGMAIAHRNDTRQLAAFLAQEGRLLLPMVELIEQSKVAVQELLRLSKKSGPEKSAIENTGLFSRKFVRFGVFRQSR
jgi:hypothetical protein